MKHQNGFSLIELVLVVGVIAAMSAGAFALYASTDSKTRVHAVATSTEAMVQNLEKGIGIRQSYYGLTNEEALDRSLIPDEFRDSGEASTPWGPLKLEPVGALYNGVRMTYEGVPSKACAEFVNRLAPLMAAIHVNGRLVGHDRRVDIQAMAAECKNGGIVMVDRVDEHHGFTAGWETWASPAAGPDYSLDPPPGTGPVPTDPIDPAPTPTLPGSTPSKPSPDPRQLDPIDPTPSPGTLEPTDPVVVPVDPTPVAPGIPWVDPEQPEPPLEQRCGAMPNTATRSLECPEGFIGSLQQSHGWIENPRPTCWTATAWQTNSGACTPIPSPHEPPPPSPPCGSSPESTYRTLACPLGSSGSILQSHGWTANESPTCWQQTPWITVSSDCTAN